MRILAAMVLMAASMTLVSVDANAQSRGGGVRPSARATATRRSATRIPTGRPGGYLNRATTRPPTRNVAQRSASRAQHIDEPQLSAAGESSAVPATRARPSHEERRAAQHQAALGQFLQRLHIQVGQQTNSRGATTSTAIAGSAE